MTRPIFGDKKTIARIDPLRVVLDDGLDIPPEVLGCPDCPGPLHVEFDDRWVEGDEFGAGTIRWYCSINMLHDFDYHYQDEVMRDENKIVRWIQTKYPTFKNEC